MSTKKKVHGSRSTPNRPPPPLSLSPSVPARASKIRASTILQVAQLLHTPIRSEAAARLALDAESVVRDTIRTAGLYAKHAKRKRMRMRDVRRAIKFRTRGSERGGGVVAMGEGRIVLLETAYEGAIKRREGVKLRAAWLEIGGEVREHGTGCMHEGFAQLGERVRSGLKGGDAEELVGEISRMRMSVAETGVVVTEIKRVVQENVGDMANADELQNGMRAISALIWGGSVAVEMYNEVILSILLTGLLGVHVGDMEEEDRAVRETAAGALRAWALWTDDVVVMGRACKTLVAALTHHESAITAVFGAVCGLTAMGKDAFRMHLLPLLPALVQALTEAVNAVDGHVENDVRLDVEQQVANVCWAVMQACRSMLYTEHDTLLASVMV